MANHHVWLATMKKNSVIINPLTGTPCFGSFPRIVYQRNTVFDAGPIYLRYGRHQGPNRGFGLEHIWKEHWKKLLSVDEALAEIPHYVAAILQQGGSIHSEFDLKNRTMVFKARKGLVILEPLLDGQNNTYYSVVTAYDGQAKGPRIGALGG